MTTEKQEKIEKLLEDLKEEIFVELDHRVRISQEELTGQISNVETKVGEKVEQKLLEDLKPWRRELYKKINEEVRGFQMRFSYYKIPYAVVVVLGFMLFWYGMWNLLARIPFFSSGWAPVVLGLTLLLISGAAYKKLVG